jgi:hypothetical protein
MDSFLLDVNYNLKLSDFGFGFSIVSHQIRQDGLLLTFCGTPYVTPEVLLC